MLSNNKIETTEWKDFKIDEIFIVSSGDCVKSEDTDNEPNEKLIPYITRGKSINSIDSYVHNKPTQKGNCITIGTQGVTAYYQNLDFISGTGVNILRANNINRYNALFICSVLNKCIQKNYRFGYELSQTRLKSVRIHLPAIQNFEGKYKPDWEYMENFIKQKEKDIEELRGIYRRNQNYSQIRKGLEFCLNNNEIIKNILNKNIGDIKLDTSNWKEYKNSDLFEYVILNKEDPNIDFQKEKIGKYIYPILNQSNDNNQIEGYAKTYKNEGNVISIDNLQTGKCFYQSENFSSIQGKHNMAVKIKEKKLTKNIALFLVNILNLNKAYSYGYQRSKERFFKEIIKLPSIQNSDGTFSPDWDYMETFIKEIKKQD